MNTPSTVEVRPKPIVSRPPVRVLVTCMDPAGRLAVRSVIENGEIDLRHVLADALLLQRMPADVDVVLCDTRLSPSVGIFSVERIRALQPGIAVVALVGRGDESTCSYLRRLGARVVRVPFAAQQVRDALLATAGNP